MKTFPTWLCCAVLIGTLSACGPSNSEKLAIATVTCNVMSESRNMDAAFRIKEINAAREKLGASPYLGNDSLIRLSISLGTCVDLVLGDQNPRPQKEQISKIADPEEILRQREQLEAQEELKRQQAIERKVESRLAAEKSKSDLYVMTKSEQSVWRTEMSKYLTETNFQFELTEKPGSNSVQSTCLDGSYFTLTLIAKDGAESQTKRCEAGFTKIDGLRKDDVVTGMLKITGAKPESRLPLPTAHGDLGKYSQLVDPFVFEWNDAS